MQWSWAEAMRDIAQGSNAAAFSSVGDCLMRRVMRRQGVWHILGESALCPPPLKYCPQPKQGPRTDRLIHR